MKIKDRLIYWKNIKNGTEIPIFNVSIDINKFKIKKEGSCNVSFHPIIFNNLPDNKKGLIEYHVSQIIDIMRDRINNAGELR